MLLPEGWDEPTPQRQHPASSTPVPSSQGLAQVPISAAFQPFCIMQPPRAFLLSPSNPGRLELSGSAKAYPFSDVSGENEGGQRCFFMPANNSLLASVSERLMALHEKTGIRASSERDSVWSCLKTEKKVSTPSQVPLCFCFIQLCKSELSSLPQSPVGEQEK